jgi:hypothetical protein
MDPLNDPGPLPADTWKPFALPRPDPPGSASPLPMEEGKPIGGNLAIGLVCSLALSFLLWAAIAGLIWGWALPFWWASLPSS